MLVNIGIRQTKHKDSIGIRNMTNETIEKELYVAPKVEVYSLEVEGIICTSDTNYGNIGGADDGFGGEFGRSWEGSFGNSRF